MSKLPGELLQAPTLTLNAPESLAGTAFHQNLKFPRAALLGSLLTMVASKFGEVTTLKLCTMHKKTTDPYRENVLPWAVSTPAAIPADFR